MRRFLEFLIQFIVLLFLQGFVFSKIDLWGLVNPYVYIMVLLMLPMRLRGAGLLGIGFLVGLILDFMSGNSGLHTICMTWLAFVRPAVLHYTAGDDQVETNGLPTPSRIGMGHFWGYVIIMSLLFSIPFFLLESMSLLYWMPLIIRILLSSAATAVSIYFLQMVLVRD